jgi:hypothetical protein
MGLGRPAAAQQPLESASALRASQTGVQNQRGSGLQRVFSLMSAPADNANRWAANLPVFPCALAQARGGLMETVVYFVAAVLLIAVALVVFRVFVRRD